MLFLFQHTAWAALAAISLIVLPSFGHAQVAPLETADELFELGDLEAARLAYEERIEAGGNTPAALALAYRRLGVLAAIVNEPERAAQWFERSLALNPSQEAPEALAPSQRSLFVLVQERRQGESAELIAESVSEVGHASLRVTSRGLPDAWVHRVQVRIGSWSAQSEDGVFRLDDAAFAGGDEVSVDCEALDEHGNVLLRASSLVTRRRAVPMPSVDEAPRRSRRGLWIGLSIVAIAGIAAAIIIPLSLRGDDTSSYGMPVIEWP